MRTIPLIIFILLLLAVSIKLLSNESTDNLIGKELPSFSRQDILSDNNVVLSNTDFQEGYNLLNIFASWCTSCIVEHKFLSQLKQNKIITTHAIAWRDSKDNIKKYLLNYGNPYQKVIIDETGEIAIKLGLTGVPETLLIGPGGKILYRLKGPLTPDIFNEEILKLIKKP